MSDGHEQAIAIVGMSVRLPGAGDVGTFWNNLARGVDSVRSFSNGELEAAGVRAEALASPAYVRARGVIDDPTGFDFGLFGYARPEAALIDPQQRVLLECAWAALEDAGFPASPRRRIATGDRVGVFAGVGLSSYALPAMLARQADETQQDLFAAFIANDKDFAASRVAYKLGLKGPCMTVQTACSTGLVAVHLAVQSLLAFETDLALAGAASVGLPAARGYVYTPDFILSRDGKTRTFDASASGTVFSQGAGVVVLKRLEDALRDGDDIYATLLGTAVNNDGDEKVAYSAPSLVGQAAVIRAAHAIAGVAAGSIGYVEAHGTGTPVGDPVEMAALTEAFASEERGFCRIGSVKSNIGHTDVAAGIAGLVKAALCLRHAKLVPSLHFESPNPRIPFEDTPFRVQTTTEDWAPREGVRRAGVSAFGIGGTNAHAILQEPPRQSARAAFSRPCVVPVSARTKAALAEQCARLATSFESGAAPFEDLAYTMAVGRNAMAARHAVVGANAAEVAARLREMPSDADGALAEANEANEGGSVAWMFPGQGAQVPGAGAELYEREPAFRRAFDGSMATLGAFGPELRARLFGQHPEAQAELTLTQFAQPALFVVEYALAQLLGSWGLRPNALIGHSVGELVAATVAGVFDPQDAVRLVALRGKLMSTMPFGAMLAVCLGEKELVGSLPPELEVAAINGPRDCVVAGPADDIAQWSQHIAKQKVACRRLVTSHAFHTRAMDPIVAEFVRAVAACARKAPTVPFVSNVTGTWITAEQAQSPEYWGQQLRSKVQFASGIELLARASGRVFLEVGPGHALTKLSRLSLPASRRRFAVAMMPPASDRGSEHEATQRGLARLWECGVDVHWAGVWEGLSAKRAHAPSYPFERTECVTRDARPFAAPAAGARATADAAVKADVVPVADVVPATGAALRVEAWLAAPGGAQPRRTFGRSVVLSDGGALADAIVRELRARVEHVDVIALPTNAGPEAVFRAMTEAIALVSDSSQPSTLVVHAWPLAANAGLDAGLLALLHLAQTAMRNASAGQVDIVVLTCGAVATSQADAALGDPRDAAMLGAIGCINAESTRVRARLIDVAVNQDGDDAAAIVDELFGADAASIVARRSGTTLIRSWTPVSLRPEPSRAGGTYVITGGAGGIGLAIAGHLSRTRNAKLALVVRRAPPPDRVTELTERLTAEGARAVAVLTADVRDRDAVRRIRREVEQRFGAIHGVVHAAGVPGGTLIVDESPDKTLEVTGPTLSGSENLLAVFEGAGLDFTVLCSSIASSVGMVGQAAYAAGHAFQSRLAEQSAARGERVAAIQWDTWREVGMAARAIRAANSTRSNADTFVAREMAPSNGERIFVSELSANHWVLDEHRVQGVALMPATGQIDLLLQTLVAHGHAAPIALDDCSFLTPLAFADGAARAVQMALAPDGSFRVESRAAASSGAWTVHTRGKMARESIFSSASAAAVREVSSARARHIPRAQEALRRASVHGIAFGKHWSEIGAELWLGDGEMLGRFDNGCGAEAHLFHPAMMDVVTGFARMMTGDAEDAMYLPILYERLAWLRAVPDTVYAHVRRRATSSRELMVFDVDVSDTSGALVVRIDGFSLKHVATGDLFRVGAAGGDTAASAAGANRGAASREVGLGTREALAAFDAIANGHRGGAIAVLSAERLASLERLPARARPPVAVATNGSTRERLDPIIEELLGISGLALDADLRDHGAHSLTFVQLSSAIEQRFGRRIGLDDLLARTTIGGIVSLLDEDSTAQGAISKAVALAASAGSAQASAETSAETGPETSAQASAETSAETSAEASHDGRLFVRASEVRRQPLLVELASGPATAPPLFCFHPAGGAIFGFLWIARHLGGRQAVYAVQGLGLRPGEVPDAEVSVMAERYLNVMKAVQPEGPYFLCGLSLGGMVAYDVAQRIVAKGGAVGWLAMLDTPGPGEGVQRPLGHSDEDVLTFVKDLAPDHFESFRRIAVESPSFLETWRIHNTAIARYQAEPYAGSVSFYRAEERDEVLPRHPERGWTELVRNGLTIRHAAGNHLTMTAEHHATTLGPVLARDRDGALEAVKR